MSSNPVPAAALFEESRITDHAVSPTGERVAYVRRDYDRRADESRTSLFVFAFDEGRPFRVTRLGDPRSPRWSPDGRHLGFIAAREPDVAVCTDEEGVRTDDATPQVWALDLERGGDARQLTTLPGGVREFDWGPAGDRLVVSARNTADADPGPLDEAGALVTERYQYKTDGVGWHDDVPTQLFVVDAATREARPLDDAVASGAMAPRLGMQPAWSPDGEHVAFVKGPDEAGDRTFALGLSLVAPDGTGLEQVLEPELTPSRLRWSPDGHWLAFTADVPGDPHEPTRLYVASPADGTCRWLTEGLDRPMAQEQQVLSWLDDDSLLGLVHDRGRTDLYRFHTNGDRERLLAGDLDGRSVGMIGTGGDAVSLLLTAPDDGTDLFAMDAADLGASNDHRRITEINRSLLADHHAPDFRRLTVESDGEEIETIAYLPPDFDPAEPDPHPLLVAVHGGPVGCDIPHYHFDWGYWTSRGYVLLRVNYRGSASYGKAFSESIGGAWGRHEPNDVIAATESLVERGWADPDRLYLQGFSYGAAVSALALARTDAFAAAAVEHGTYDYRSAFGTSDMAPFLEATFGLPWERPEAYESMSALDDATGIDTPVLVMGGGNDYRAPATQAEQLYKHLKRRGVESRLVIYATENHGVNGPGRSVHRLRQLTDWFENSGSRE